ncbi:MAG: 3'(2'),5'-bisphosphate nucleotidase CysQ [Alphaproteobacteria bacterium]|nr:3'(2'),5'-bisphosphate nucleotidase CysQ [Alphaproteobacteria bacterium]
MSGSYPIEHFIDVCLDISDHAGRKIMEVYAREDFGTQRKTDHSPVTDADLAANRIIVDALKDLTPEIAIVSEEESFKPEGHSAFWLVDPLDGTREFIKRNGEFTVNIALVVDQTPILGVIVAPALGVAYTGGIGLAARKRDDSGQWFEISVKEPMSDRDIKIAGSKNHMTDASRHWIKANCPDSEVIGIGSSVKFCLIAEGAAHFYPRFGQTMEWDTAAGHAILNAAGGSVIRMDGHPFIYGKDGFGNADFLAQYHPS